MSLPTDNAMESCGCICAAASAAAAIAVAHHDNVCAFTEGASKRDRPWWSTASGRVTGKVTPLWTKDSGGSKRWSSASPDCCACVGAQRRGGYGHARRRPCLVPGASPRAHLDLGGKFDCAVNHGLGTRSPICLLSMVLLRTVIKRSRAYALTSGARSMTRGGSQVLRYSTCPTRLFAATVKHVVCMERPRTHSFMVCVRWRTDLGMPTRQAARQHCPDSQGSRRRTNVAQSARSAGLCHPSDRW